MAFQPAPDACSVVVKGSNGLKNSELVLHRTLTVPLTQAVADTVGGEISASLVGLGAFMNSGSNYTSVTVTDLRTDGAPQFDSVSGFPIAGASVAGFLPLMTCGLIKWKTGFRGGEGRGRTFLWGFAEDASDGYSPSAGCIAAMQDVAQDIIDIGLYVVLSRFKGTDKTIEGHRPKPIPRASAISHPFTSFIVDDEWKTQRRRNPR